MTILVIAAGTYFYYKHPQHLYHKRLNAINPFITTGNKEIISEDVLKTLQDTAGSKIAVKSLYTGYEYWQGRPVTHKTIVEGTMLFTDNTDSTGANAVAVKKEVLGIGKTPIKEIKSPWRKRKRSEKENEGKI